VGGGIMSQKPTVTVWPTPAGLGETLMKAYVGMFNAGECALAFGISIVEADIESIKNIAIAIAAVLFLAICIFLFSSFNFIERKHNEYAPAQQSLSLNSIYNIYVKCAGFKSFFCAANRLLF
jgi:hypothetical protein